ncbi:MAG: hypothetical protein D3906_14410 [Candidatus Electrothrix sp. AUS1_2]|nr:hypothetical protein [Candidatus Electrothrix sp. AUS1_2]
MKNRFAARLKVLLKKMIFGILKVVAATAILCFIGIFLLTGGHFFRKSGRSNCVIVEDESRFTGRWLKHSQAVLYARMRTEECRAEDQAIDAGDGSLKGKVRWAECTYGPDCDEAGMY